LADSVSNSGLTYDQSTVYSFFDGSKNFTCADVETFTLA
jgi:hypothetical protein